MSDIRTENGEGQNIKPNFTPKTSKQSMPLNIKKWGTITFVSMRKWRQGRVDIIVGVFVCFAYLPNVFPVSRIVPGKSKQVGSQIFF